MNKRVLSRGVLLKHVACKAETPSWANRALKVVRKARTSMQLQTEERQKRCPSCTYQPGASIRQGQDPLTCELRENIKFCAEMTQRPTKTRKLRFKVSVVAHSSHSEGTVSLLRIVHRVHVKNWDHARTGEGAGGMS